MSWTNESIATLKRLFARGLSVNQIACELGGVSRNAVIGKIHRLGLARPAGAPKPATQGRGGGRPKSGGAPRRRSNVLALCGWAQPVARALPAPLPVGERPDRASDPGEGDHPNACTLLDLKHDSCRWPLGPKLARAVLFCGEPRADARVPGLDGRPPYCAMHCRLAYQRAGAINLHGVAAE